jgi:hypothetical protein
MKKRVSDILGTYTDPIPIELIRAFEVQKCVLLAGAGVSRRCLTRDRQRLPDWEGLLSRLLDWASERRLIRKRTISDMRKLTTSQQHLLVAEELIDLLGNSAIHDFLSEVFDPDGMVPSRLHELLVTTPFRWLFTTNYDNLLERAFISIHNRHIESLTTDDLKRLNNISSYSRVIVKLHGDLEKPETIVLGQRRYQVLFSSRHYNRFLENVFSQNSVLMVGYGLNDADILLAIDRLATISRSMPHFLLSKRGERSSIEKKRLSLDRNIHLIEYDDYFGYHNHIDTFLTGLNVAIGNENALSRVRAELRCRIQVHYPHERQSDGLFVWNFIFRQGAITLHIGTQHDKQLSVLETSITEGLYAIDYLLFIVDDKCLGKENRFLKLLKRAIKAAPKKNVQIVFLVIGASRRPKFLKENNQHPCFFVEEQFSEKDLLVLRSYIAQDITVGLQQP